VTADPTRPEAPSATLADRDFKRILLIKLSAIGDVVHTIPLLHALRRRYPAARIDWLSKPSPAAFLRGLPGVDNIYVYGENQTEAPRYNWDGVAHWVGLIRDQSFLSTLARLRRARYDLVIDMQGQLRSAFVTMVAGAPVRIGFDRPRPAVWRREGERLPKGTIERAWKGSREGAWHAYTHPVRLPTLEIHAVDKYLLAADMLGCEPAAPDFTMPAHPEAALRVAELFRAHKAEGMAPIAIAPGAQWETKRWRVEGFAAVARHFLLRGYPVLLIGSAGEIEVCRRIAALAPGAAVIAGETSLSELAELIARSAFVVTNDSGPLHLAVALARPVVALFGPTNPAWVGPYRRPKAALTQSLPCSPCYLRDMARCAHDHACMRGITPERVIAFMEERLEPRRGQVISETGSK
jgi:ADP-heptose:LPS heptosyltransferase